MLTFGSSVIMFIEYLMVFLGLSCKCKGFFTISNTFSQLFSEPNSLISKDIKFFIEAPFSRVKYRCTLLVQIVKRGVGPVVKEVLLHILHAVLYLAF